jgi:PleD family two-component response regulator
MNGDECTLKIKQKVKEGYQDVVIVGHSSDDGKTTADNFIKNGANIFEKKPISFETLLSLYKD